MSTTPTKPIATSAQRCALTGSPSILIDSAATNSGLATAPLFQWRTVSATAWTLLALNGALNGGAHFLMIEALRLGEAATVVPFKYSGLVWGLLLGFVVWRHVPDAWMLVGAALVAASGLYLLRLEYRSAPRRLAQPSGASRRDRAG